MELWCALRAHIPALTEFKSQLRHQHAGVAQLAELLFCKQPVAGSIPVTSFYFCTIVV